MLCLLLYYSDIESVGIASAVTDTFIYITLELK